MHIISNWYLVKVKAHLEALQVENDHLSREIAILRETVKVNILLNSKKVACDFHEVASNDVKGHIKRCERCKRVYIIEIHLRHLTPGYLFKKYIWYYEIFQSNGWTQMRSL